MQFAHDAFYPFPALSTRAHHQKPTSDAATMKRKKGTHIYSVLSFFSRFPLLAFLLRALECIACCDFPSTVVCGFPSPIFGIETMYARPTPLRYQSRGAEHQPDTMGIDMRTIQTRHTALYWATHTPCFTSRIFATVKMVHRRLPIEGAKTQHTHTHTGC